MVHCMPVNYVDGAIVFTIFGSSCGTVETDLKIDPRALES